MFFQWRAAVDARVETEHQRSRAEVRGLVSEARNQEPAGKVGEALALLRAAAAIEDSEKETGVTQVALDMERLGRAGAGAQVLAGHAWGLTRVVVSPDGKLLATASRDGTAKVWDLATGAVVRTLAGTEPVLSIVWAPDGNSLVTCNGTQGANDGFVHFWDAATGTERRSVKLGSTVNEIAFSPDGKRLAVATEKNGASLWQPDGSAQIAMLGDAGDTAGEVEISADGALVLVRAGKEVRVHAIADGALVATLAGHEKGILDAAFSRSGAQVATASIDGTVRVWDARSGKEIAKLAPQVEGYGKPTRFQSIAWAPDGKLVAAGAQDGSVRLIDAASGAVVHTLLHHTSTIEEVVFSPDGRRLLVASLDHTATLWDTETAGLVEVLRGHKEGLLCATFAGDHRVVTGSDDRQARVWEIADGPFVRVLAGHTGSIDRLVASSDGAVLASGATDKTVRVWDAKTGAALSVLGEHKGPVSALAISPDGKVIVTGAVDTPTRLWDARSGAERAALVGEEKGSNAAAFSPDGKLLVTASLEGPVHLRDGATGAEKRVLSGHAKKVVRLAFSGDGKRLVSASWDGTARLWDVSGDVGGGAGGGAESRVLQGTEGWVTAAIFSPDDKTVAIAANEEARVFDAATGALLRSLKGHEQQINALVYSPDGALIATASLDGTLRTWRADTGALVRRFTGHSEGALDVAFSPDGELLYSAGDSTVRVWHVGLGVEIDRLEAHRNDSSLQGTTALLTLGPDLVVSAAQDGTILLFRSSKVDRKLALATTGALSNDRVCRQSLRVVPVTPYPAADSVWAPDDACKDKDEAPAPAPSAAAK